MGLGYRKMICKHGHDISVCGRTERGVCKMCYKDMYCVNPKVRIAARRYGWKEDGILNENGDQFNDNDFNRLFQIQGGKCALCGIHQRELSRALCVDHNKKTGMVRGLLCMLCNRNMVGKHTIDTANKLLIYLKKDLSLVSKDDATATNYGNDGCGDATATNALEAKSSFEEIKSKVV